MELLSATLMTCLTQYPFEKEWNIYSYQMMWINTILQLSQLTMVHLTAFAIFVFVTCGFNLSLGKKDFGEENYYESK